MRSAFAVLVWLSCVALMEPAFAASPSKVNVSLQVGDSVESALVALNAKGFHIVYSSALVTSSMTLRTVPTSSKIEVVLHEILSPWKLKAVHTANDEWLVVRGDSVPNTAEDSVSVTAAAPPLETVEVNGSRFSLATQETSKVFLDRAEIEHMPHLADDAMRMLKVLPGVSGGDYSAALNIRGGRRDETLLLVDGAEIHNATHFRDLDGAFSVLDTHLIQGIDFITGGMTADYGNYMSGVVDMKTRRPTSNDEYQNSAGISFVSAFGSSGGTFAEERGAWLISARRGFLDLLVDHAADNGNQLVPRYTDVFASTSFELGKQTSLAAHVLHSNDDLRLVDKNSTEDVSSAGLGRSTHFWLTLDDIWYRDFYAKTVFAVAELNLTRNARGSDHQRNGDVTNDNDFQFIDFRQDWAWKGGDNHLPRWGFSVNRQKADYNYALRAQITDPFITPTPIDTVYGTKLTASGSKYGIYGSWRIRIINSITVEAGSRWDVYHNPESKRFDVVSPRFNLVYQLNERNVFRAAWSVVNQPQGVSELQVEDNVTKMFGPERSEQAVVGYSTSFDYGLSLRLEIYDKRYSKLRPRFENAINPIQLIPEGAVDRILIDAPQARARGIELTLRREMNIGLAGWISLAVAKAEEKEQGEWRPRTWEQQQTVSFGSSWTGAKWNISLAGLFHSGTPTTYIGTRNVSTAGNTVLYGVVGDRNADRTGIYSRIDLRANRTVQLQRGRFSYYLEVTNLLDRKNECCIEDFGLTRNGNGQAEFYLDRGYGLPMLPSIGLQFDF